MQKDELLRKAYIGDAIPGFIHNIGNPIGALLGFIAILRDDADKMKEEIKKMPEGETKARLTEIGANFDEFLGLAGESERTLRDILDRFIRKWNKDAANEIEEINLIELMETETEIMTTNRFFKHKIKKEIAYADYVKSVWGIWRTVSQPVSSLLMRYALALENVKNPVMKIAVSEVNGKPAIKIAANARLLQESDESLAAPAFTLQECIDALRPLATVRYSEPDTESSCVEIEFAGDGQ